MDKVRTAYPTWLLAHLIALYAVTPIIITFDKNDHRGEADRNYILW